MLKVSAQLFIRSAATFAGLLFLLAAAPALASSGCEGVKGCDRKFCEIEQQLDIAQENGNKYQVAGLEKALKEAKQHCTDEGLREDLIDDIQDAKEDLAEYKADLRESEEDGDMDDRRKYQHKIEEEKAEIQQLENELSHLD
jgi:small-conductance mechanosensitive channel